MAAAKVILAALIIGGVEKMRERRLEYRLHFKGIERQVKWSLDPSYDRHDPEARGNLVIRKPSEHRHGAAVKANLLFGLAQRCLLAAGVVRLDAPTRKTDLPRVIVEMCCALRKKNMELVRQRHEYRRLSDPRTLL